MRANGNGAARMPGCETLCQIACLGDACMVRPAWPAATQGRIALAPPPEQTEALVIRGIGHGAIDNRGGDRRSPAVAARHREIQFDGV